jgi:hypothetical protein
LQLAEHAASAEEREGDADGRGDHTFARLRRLSGNAFDDVDSTLIEKIAHLLRYLVPGACQIVAENDANHREQHENQRRERKNCVIGKRCTGNNILGATRLAKYLLLFLRLSLPRVARLEGS